ncbi:Caudovirales tail fibre assembly protein [Sodalis glossinidius str. 'morsitans']|uniref:Caudovirales tail fibre assembly protein n=1 Tax=Sodalis glossinidius (strain morsitans) TaxID=343509 RepID=Q2NRZ4_SODGM|nr:tail fiber assembly protein [Sodalis glossinidius]BAE75081.1 conserved hypothetical protein [Sodalis glossinidius str. 'morsitans']CRL45993.1 Caudovirales tail fibre assembly protein [Sodalis glossinidius str. 'morsitans']
MNDYFYSATTNGFYHISMKSIYEDSDNGWPEDAVPVSNELYQALLEGQSKNKIIKANKNGMPVLGDRPAPTEEQNLSMAQSKKSMLLEQATGKIIPLQDAVDLNMATQVEETTLLMWKKYRVMLTRLDVSKATDIAWPQCPE